MTTLLSPSELTELQEQIQHLTVALQVEQAAREKADADLLAAVNALSLARLKLAILKHKLPESQHGRIDSVLEILARV